MEQKVGNQTIERFEDLHHFVESFDKKVIIYRGVTDSSYELIPKIGRYDKFKAMDKEEFAKQEKMIFRLFREQARPYLESQPENLWEWLAIAQQHRLPTRLLDWTRNPLVAAYFAVEQVHEGDSAICAYHNNRHVDREDYYEDPLECNYEGARFIPPHVTRRITVQAGVFTIHGNPRESFKSDQVTRAIVKSEFRKELKHILFKYGIHRASLFPDLDDLAQHIEWLQTDVY